MNLERLRWGEWIAVIAALDLLLVTFRSWYKVSGADVHVTAWDALDTGRYLLIATAVVGIALFLIQASEDAARAPWFGWLTAVVGLACTVYIAYRLATPPSDALDADIGIYFGLAGALGVAIGGLLSAREASAPATATFQETTTFEGPTGPAAEPLGALVPDSGGTWSPAPAAGSAGGWSPAAPVPPATPAGAGFADPDRPVQAGDTVALTAGGARFPAGTLAEVVEVFGGGALVEVKAADGMAERFEVPESAFQRVPPGGGAPPTEATSPSTAGESWSPAMPAAATGGAAGATAGEDWGFEESASEGAEAPAGEAPAEKVPWWKRDIGGGKKKKDEAEGAALGAGAAAAAGAAIATRDEEETNGTAEAKPGFFKRLFGGGAKAEPETEAVEAPAEDVAGSGEAAESDTAAAPEPVVEPEPIAAEPEPAPPAPEPEPVAAEPEPEPEPPAPEPEPVAAEPEPEPEPPAPEPEPVAAEPEPEPPAPEPEPPAPEPKPEPPAPEPEPEPVAAEPEPEPEPPAPAPEAEVPAPDPEPEPEPQPPAPEPETAAAAEPEASSGEPPAAEEEAPKPKPKRKRSSGSRKVPKEAVAAATSDDGPPKVGDEVQLKVSGGKFDAGTRGTVVDVFSAGVIVELSDSEGNVERLDLPFEAVGPADA